jgi:hypothetical protein
VTKANPDGEEVVSLDDILDEYTPRTVTVRLLTRGDLIADLERLERELAEARMSDDRLNEPDRAPSVARQIEEVQTEARRYEREFVFQEVGRREWTDLLAEHPPSKEQRDLGLDHNPDTFLPAGIAASCVKPVGVTVEGIAKLADKLGAGRYDLLWGACLAANRGDSRIPSSAAASVLRLDSGPNSTTRRPSGSPDPSS